MLRRRGSQKWAIRLAVTLAALTVIAIVWEVHQSHLPRRPGVRHAAPAPRAAASSIVRETSVPAPPAGARYSFLLHPTSQSSPASVTPQQEDTDTTDTEIIRLHVPISNVQETSPASDARAMRALLDRGVVAYASAAKDGDRTKGV